MADTTVDSVVDANTQGYHRGPAFQDWYNEDEAWQVFLETGLDLERVKLSDWTGTPTVGTPSDVSVQVCRAVATWSDKATPGITSTYFHILIWETSTDDLIHFRIDTSDGSLSTEVTVVAESAVHDSTNTQVSICRARSGRLYALARGNGTSGKDYFCYSDDDGDSWTTTLANPYEGAVDWQFLMPGNETDSADIIAVWGDLSANEVTIKTYDASGDSWAESSSFASMVDSSGFWGVSGCVRHSDNHTIIMVIDEHLSGTGDIEVYDYNNVAAGAPSALTNLETNINTYAQGQIGINQQNDDLYAFYMSSAGGNVIYRKSTDDGSTWSSQTAYSEGTAADNRAIYMDPSIDDDGGFIAPAWASNTNTDLYINAVNDVAIAAVSGTTYTQTHTATITPGGTVIKRAGKAIASSTTPAGTVIKAVNKSIAATVTPAGVVLKQWQHLFDGTITPTATVTNIITRLISLAATITPTSTVVKNVTKNIAATITPAGTVGKLFSTAFTGTITSSGEVLKQWQSTFVGAVAPAGTVVKQINKGIAATITPAGTVVKLISKSIAATVTPAGTVAKLIAKLLAGVITPTGDIGTELIQPPVDVRYWEYIPFPEFNHNVNIPIHYEDVGVAVFDAEVNIPIHDTYVEVPSYDEWGGLIGRN